ncbi:MAG: NAD(+)--dinitrogen-reductase ADP-D-ribosyltransferase [Methylomonas sp.]|jgi:NAD+--dinitrogen-reductase ADP-D-ribosyltransferase|uniref:NAD(+)--dinitrogen-reductase ADP-D-ribosyltransferase n=1 Tax=Methylomonas sp. TaxID=418 RepID=UPI0025D9717C|nr:NAD(+)--dinitrogen-reductase ADP-D-ribosyltransferase [Methylomonas sp.]MCK9608583.1 NAD(+)--dinitrogen-reductase ADP-D-ribosyltransferase [Methylomonas sp.]
MSAISRYGHSTNLIGIATSYMASPLFNDNPQALRIAGTREAAAGLFDKLAQQPDLAACGQVFQDYMCVVFGFEAEQRLGVDKQGRRRFRSSYLRLIQDWGLDSNNAQGAVFKGWVESRFGLFPNFHKQPLDSFRGKNWLVYIEEKMNSRYHNNCIFMQLDLLYEYCQWVIARFQIPAARHKTLYRGVNTLDDCSLVADEDKTQKLVRFNSLVSFTDRRSIASEFGAYILQVQVPVVKLIFFNELLPHHALHGEAEYLAIGGDYRVKVQR